MDVRYEAPETLQAAVALLASATGPAKILAGGTDVIVQMETDLIEPSLLVDIKKIPELRQIALWKVEGYTHEEIAARLDCVPRTIERKVSRIRLLWKHELENRQP